MIEKTLLHFITQNAVTWHVLGLGGVAVALFFSKPFIRKLVASWKFRSRGFRRFQKVLVKGQPAIIAAIGILETTFVSADSREPGHITLWTISNRQLEALDLCILMAKGA